MILSSLFHICSAAVVPGWILLIVAPRWRWTHRITTFILTLPLAALYLGLFLAHWNSSLSFGSLDQVYAIFQDPGLLLAGWLHYLAFVRDARRIGIPHLLVVPCLIGTFLVGPIGLLLYLLLRFILQRRIGAED
jgi:ABA DEFICIENT 4-like